MGVFAGFLVGGHFNVYFSWRTTFVIIGMTTDAHCRERPEIEHCDQ
jgi:hypothetical protein